MVRVTKHLQRSFFSTACSHRRAFFCVVPLLDGSHGLRYPPRRFIRCSGSAAFRASIRTSRAHLERKQRSMQARSSRRRWSSRVLDSTLPGGGICYTATLLRLGSGGRDLHGLCFMRAQARNRARLQPLLGGVGLLTSASATASASSSSSPAAIAAVTCTDRGAAIGGRRALPRPPRFRNCRKRGELFLGLVLARCVFCSTRMLLACGGKRDMLRVQWL